MARQRRGGGFRPPEIPLRGTLGTLLRTAAAQVGPLRDALERTAREGLGEARSRLDDALAARASGSRARYNDHRTDALAELGTIVLELIRQGEIDLAELPEVREIVSQLDELDAADSAHEEEHDEQVAAPPSRNRFDARKRDDSDGTVSSKTWRPPVLGARSAPPAKKPANVWRPPLDNDEADHRPTDEITARERPASRPVPKPKDPLSKGGITFDDDDDDLADYMHPDDVPAKPPKDGDS